MIFAAVVTLISLLSALSYGLIGLVYLLVDISLCYLLGLIIEKKKFVLWISIIIHAAVLVFFRIGYFNIANITAPIGISYYTLLVISYHADIYRGKIKAEKNLLSYALYICYFPRLLMGPLQRYDNWKGALEKKSLKWDNIVRGGSRAIWGLFKQLVIASRAAVIVNEISASPETYKGAYVILALLLYSVELYADFSGAMDIVIGISKMIGIELPENFDRPYFSESVQEFWRRWHITLGAWLRDYIYIPLGGSRKGKIRKLINTVVVFVVSGFWHGTQYLVWGVLNGIFVAIGDRLKIKFKTINRIFTFVIITLLWSFFVWPTTKIAFEQVGSIFTTFNYSEIASKILSLGLDFTQWIVLLSGILILWIYDGLKSILEKKTNGRKAFNIIIFSLALLLALVIVMFGMYGIGFNAEAFIYSRF